MSGAHRPGEATGLVRWLPTTEKPRRNWIIAGSSTLLLVAVLVVFLNSETTSRPEATDGAVSAPSWFEPGAPDVGVSAPLPAGPPSQDVNAPFLPPDGAPGIPAVVADGPAAPGSSGSPAPKPADSSSPLPSAPARTTPATPTPAAPQLTAYDIILGETFDDRYSVEIEADESGSGVHIGFIHRGDWVSYDDIDFTDVPAKKMQISAAGYAAGGKNGQVEVYLDSLTSSPIGRMTIPNNGSWFDFVTYSMPVQPTVGKHRVFLKFAANHSVEFANVDWFRFQH